MNIISWLSLFKQSNKPSENLDKKESDFLTEPAPIWYNKVLVLQPYRGVRGKQLSSDSR